ncbi:MAG TPA: MBL fold metallo-hydrolase, partial [Firmicutes bacterium]|nr:MBL fold metallo-hydrolase [Bacillota bacterium]
MAITWLGHACFMIETGTGLRILTDPFDESVGYELPAVEADVVTV